jgi:VanZ family protein
MVCLACAVADETHQVIVPTRSGSLQDVAIDVAGAAGALLIALGGTARAGDQMRRRVAVEPAD